MGLMRARATRSRTVGERQQRHDRERDLGTAGKYGNALSFNGTNARVTVADSDSLHLTRGMTLEAWVNPATATRWRDVIYKGNDNYYLEGTDDTAADRPAGGTFAANLYGTLGAGEPTPGRIWRRPTTGRRCGCM